MQKPLTKQQKMEQLTAYHRRLLLEPKKSSIALNERLLSNPFLRDRPQFAEIGLAVSQYNQRVHAGHVRDPYEAMSYERIHSMLADLAQIDTRQDQVKALEQLHIWFKEQRRLVQQRRDQGVIRYHTLKKDPSSQTQIQLNENQTEKQPNPFQHVPTELMMRFMEPYSNQNRTVHKELDLPIRRLNEYKRKIINLGNFLQQKEEERPPRITYPRPPKVEVQKEEQPAAEGGQGQADGKIDGVPPIEGAEPNAEGKDLAAEAAAEQDFGGGLGEEPEEPEEQEAPETKEDKLAPTNKIYIEAIKTDREPKYRGAYLHYRGSDILTERNLEQMYLRHQHDAIRRQRDNQNVIDLTHDWAKKKSKAIKDLSSKLEQRAVRPKYSYSVEEEPKIERLSQPEELKFGFTQQLKSRPKYSDISFDSHRLPKLQEDVFDQKSIRRERINSLKKQYGKLLNLTQYEQREAEPSLCQFTARKRGFSEIVRSHSKSKERLNQLEEVLRIKEKLTRGKIGLNIKMLSQGLCLPEGEDRPIQDATTTVSADNFPTKDLPSNPFMVETKKKKKK